jgi:hypothetical protein
VSKVSLPTKILYFFLRFLFLYLATLLLWFFIQPYYETLLWLFTIKASQWFGYIAFHSPKILNGTFYCHVANGRMSFTVRTITLNLLIAVPLLCSTSAIPLVKRMKMIGVGLLFLFLFQSLFLLVLLYSEVYRMYPAFIQKEIPIDQVVSYSPVAYRIFAWLNYFFNSIFKFVVAVGIWIGLVSYYKRNGEQHWPERLF